MKPELYLSHPEADFWADFSFVDFPDDYLSSMESNITSALQAMQQLESGAIANPDENRMVGHYWLRNADLAPSEELTTAFEKPGQSKRGCKCRSFRLSPVPTGYFY